MKTHPYAVEVRSLLTDLVADGFKLLSITDGDEWELVSNIEQSIEIICGVDDSFLVAGKGEDLVQLYIVLGNEPGVIVCDHSLNHDLERIVKAHYDKFNE